MKKKLLLICSLLLSVNMVWSQGFKISGTQLLDANGNNFVMKGVNVPLAWFVTDVNNNIANIKNVTGSNCFRIVVTTSTSDAAWQTCVQNCINNKVIPLVELHDVTGNNSPSELNRMATWWASKAAYLNRPEISKYILINIANEWSDWYMSATATGTVSRVTWRDAYITAVKTIRNAGINTTLVVDAAGYGQDNKAQTILSYAKDVQAGDPQHNCLFSIHMYCEWSVGGNSSITSLLPAVKNAGIPVIVGEFGYQHSEGSSICDINESQIISTANANGIGWLAWSWKGNGSPVQYLDLSTNWTGTSLSSWGNTVVNGSGGTKTALNASVFSSTTVNKVPTVNITSPVNNTNFTAPASITINAIAADADGTISNVQFYNGTTLLGSDASSPYSFIWNNVDAGTYTFTAKATDNSGAVTTSTSIQITMNAPIQDCNGVAGGTASIDNCSVCSGGNTGVAPNSTCIRDCNGVWNGSAFMDGCGTCVGGNTGKTACSPNPSGNCLTTAVPLAADWIIRNDWTDQNMGSVTSNITDAMKVTHRQWGRDYLWLIESAAKRVKVQAGKTYTISFDFKDDAVNKVTSLQVGLASSYQWNGPVLAQPVTTMPSGTSSGAYTIKSISLTANVTGDFYLVIREQWAGQVSLAVTNYIKNLKVCEGTSTASAALPESALAPNPSSGAFSLTASENISSFVISNMAGLVVYNGTAIAEGESIVFGEGLSAGNYILRIIYSSGRTETKTIQRL